jgi:hypothetical protein
MNFSRLDRRASWGTGGRNWVRTSDPSLVRRTRTVARRRPPWPEVPSSMTNRRQMSLYAARRLPPLAPRLAPLNLVSRANWWYRLARGCMGTARATITACVPSRWCHHPKNCQTQPRDTMQSHRAHLLCPRRVSGSALTASTPSASPAGVTGDRRDVSECTHHLPPDLWRVRDRGPRHRYASSPERAAPLCWCPPRPARGHRLPAGAPPA